MCLSLNVDHHVKEAREKWQDAYGHVLRPVPLASAYVVGDRQVKSEEQAQRGQVEGQQGRGRQGVGQQGRLVGIQTFPGKQLQQVEKEEYGLQEQ